MPARRAAPARPTSTRESAPLRVLTSVPRTPTGLAPSRWPARMAALRGTRGLPSENVALPRAGTPLAGGKLDYRGDSDTVHGCPIGTSMRSADEGTAPTMRSPHVGLSPAMQIGRATRRERVGAE